MTLLSEPPLLVEKINACSPKVLLGNRVAEILITAGIYRPTPSIVSQQFIVIEPANRAARAQLVDSFPKFQRFENDRAWK